MLDKILLDVCAQELKICKKKVCYIKHAKGAYPENGVYPIVENPIFDKLYIKNCSSLFLNIKLLYIGCFWFRIAVDFLTFGK